MSNGVEIAIENLKTELRDINLKISELRKAGLDVKIAELKVMNIPYKIQFAEVTKGYNDIEKINNMLGEVKSEIANIENANKTCINNNGLNDINILINKINRAIGENRLQEAKSYYSESVRLYKKLKNANKKEIFEKLNKLRTKLIEIS
jgi:hypothetical protein